MTRLFIHVGRAKKFASKAAIASPGTTVSFQEAIRGEQSYLRRGALEILGAVASVRPQK